MAAQPPPMLGPRRFRGNVATCRAEGACSERAIRRRHGDDAACRVLVMNGVDVRCRRQLNEYGDARAAVITGCGRQPALVGRTEHHSSTVQADRDELIAGVLGCSKILGPAKLAGHQPPGRIRIITGEKDGGRLPETNRCRA